MDALDIFTVIVILCIIPFTARIIGGALEGASNAVIEMKGDRLMKKINKEVHDDCAKLIAEHGSFEAWKESSESGRYGKDLEETWGELGTKAYWDEHHRR
jgi:hypothetical protein